MNHWTTPVCRDGYLYGIYGFKEFGTAPLKCVEIARTELNDGAVWIQVQPGGIVVDRNDELCEWPERVGAIDRSTIFEHIRAKTE